MLKRRSSKTRSKLQDSRTSKWPNKLLRRLPLSSRSREKLPSDRENSPKKKEFRRQFKQRLLWPLLNSRRSKLQKRLPSTPRSNASSRRKKHARKTKPESALRRKRGRDSPRRRLRRKQDLRKKLLMQRRRDLRRNRSRKSSERRSSKRPPDRQNSMLSKPDTINLQLRRKKN